MCPKSHERARKLVKADIRTAQELADVNVRAATRAEVNWLIDHHPTYREANTRLTPIVVSRADKIYATIFLPTEDDFAALLQSLADEIQETLVGSLSWRAWPKCPYHAHQLLATEEDGKAFWKCPLTNEAVCEIGQYVLVAGQTGAVE